MDHSQHQTSNLASVSEYFSQIDFMPHGHCYLWKPGLVWTHVISDTLIGLAYFSISLILYGLVRKIKIPFSAIVLSFGVFIGACGLTHFMEIWNLWNADYWVSGWVKVLTALASVSTGIYLYKLRHPLVLVAEAAKLSEQRRLDLEVLTTDLENRVDQRTRELKESEEKFKLIIEFIPQMVWSTDAEGKYNFFNQRWYDFSGLNKEESEKSYWQKLVHPDDLLRTQSAWRESLQTGNPYEIEYRMKNKDGHFRWLLERALPIRNSSGKITQWFGTCTDIEDQKNTEQKLVEAINARDQFLSIASHELKTPLTSLLLQTQLYERKLNNTSLEFDEASLNNFLSILYKQAIRLSNVISDMLDVSRIKSNRFEYSIEKIEFKSYLQEIFERLCHQFEEGKCKIQNTLPAETFVNIDPHRIEQVLNNILNNISKYAPRSDVFLKANLHNHFVRIEIEDTGPGISSDKLEQIFAKFERASDMNEQTGLGLGLYISREIIEGHQGKIWAESTLGKGARFIIEIPPAPAVVSC